MALQSTVCRVREFTSHSGLRVAVAKAERDKSDYREGIDPVICFSVDHLGIERPASRQLLVPIRPDLLRSIFFEPFSAANLETLTAAFKAKQFPSVKHFNVSGITLFANEFDPPLADARIWTDSNGIGAEYQLRSENDTASRWLNIYGHGYDQDSPEKRHPDWPDQRPLHRYNELIKANRRMEPSIQNLLGRGGIWFDLGGGKGAAITDLKMRNVERALAGIHWYPEADAFGVHPGKKRSTYEISRIPPKIFNFYAEIPNNLFTWGIYMKRVTLGTDIYGPVSYCENPLDCLIYEAGLLRDSKSVLFAITEVSRFGAVNTWGNIERFFNNYSGQHVEFRTFLTRRDSDGKREESLRIKIQGEGRYESPFPTVHDLRTGHVPNAPDHFEVARRMARDYVGNPYIGDAIWPPRSQSRWTIRTVDYH